MQPSNKAQVESGPISGEHCFWHHLACFPLSVALSIKFLGLSGSLLWFANSEAVCIHLALILKSAASGLRPGNKSDSGAGSLLGLLLGPFCCVGIFFEKKKMLSLSLFLLLFSPVLSSPFFSPLLSPPYSAPHLLSSFWIFFSMRFLPKEPDQTPPGSLSTTYCCLKTLWPTEG